MTEATDPIYIAESIRGLAVPIGDVKPHPRNARQGDIGAISESLQRFGQQKPIVAQRKTKRIVAGNHTWQAAKALGWEQIAVVYADLSDKQALAFMVADNRTQELGSYNDDALISLLTEVAGGGELAGTGYDGDDLDELMRRTGALGREASGFLDPLLGSGPAEGGTGASSGEPATRNGRDAEGRDYFALMFNVTAEQREVVSRGLRAARAAGHKTQPEQLVALAAAYEGGLP